MNGLKYLILSLVAAMSVLGLASCSASDEPSGEYYVRYEVSVVAPDSAKNLVGFTTPDGVDYSTIVGSNSAWQATYGPVSKGFKASVTCSDFRNSVSHTLRISVSKGNAPFVVKANGGTDYLDLDYVVDDD